MPIIERIKTKNFDLIETEVPETSYDNKFLVSMMNNPENIRNVRIYLNLGGISGAFAPR